MSTKIRRFARSILLNSKRRFIWLFQDSKVANLDSLTAHLLIVKNPIYAVLARTCIESFLHFHPNSQIIIYYDSKTLRTVYWQLSFLRFVRRRKITFRKTSENITWQESKLDIILSMEGTNQIFMDCDLRWNGPVFTPQNEAILYFVEEKPLASYSKMHHFLPRSLHAYRFSSMKNTSVFSWSECKISRKSGEEIKSLWQNIYSSCYEIPNEEKQSLLRISEQVVLSILPELLKIPSIFLKEGDNQFDGSICESSYYGAARGRFAFWGNTNRSPVLRRR